jgi:hypothetical protein
VKWRWHESAKRHRPTSSDVPIDVLALVALPCRRALSAFVAKNNGNSDHVKVRSRLYSPSPRPTVTTWRPDRVRMLRHDVHRDERRAAKKARGRVGIGSGVAEASIAAPASPSDTRRPVSSTTICAAVAPERIDRQMTIRLEFDLDYSLSISRRNCGVIVR